MRRATHQGRIKKKRNLLLADGTARSGRTDEQSDVGRAAAVVRRAAEHARDCLETHRSRFSPPFPIRYSIQLNN